MEKAILIQKWLDNDLTDTEFKEFEQLEEFDSYMKLSEKAQFFKAPNFDSAQAYNAIKPLIDKRRAKKSVIKRLRPYAQVAAAVVIGFTIYSLFFFNDITTIETLASQKTTIILPDASSAQLNSLSEISFNEKTWNKQRTVELDGEAFFKVAKGSQFDVETASGVVSVLGTEFNVKNRANYFEVKCFEGKVSVHYNGKTTMLPAGNTLRIINGNVSSDITELDHPSWIENKSTFKSVPLSEVLAELERQFDVQVTTDANTNALYSGIFVHDSIQLALKSITIPFGLDYAIINNKVTLSKIE